MTKEDAIRLLNLPLREGYLKGEIQTAYEQKISDLEIESKSEKKSIDEAVQFLTSQLALEDIRYSEAVTILKLPKKNEYEIAEIEKAQQKELTDAIGDTHEKLINNAAANLKAEMREKKVKKDSAIEINKRAVKVLELPLKNSYSSEEIKSAAQKRKDDINELRDEGIENIHEATQFLIKHYTVPWRKALFIRIKKTLAATKNNLINAIERIKQVLKIRFSNNSTQVRRMDIIIITWLALLTIVIIWFIISNLYLNNKF